MSMRDRLFWEEQHENMTRERCRNALEALAELPIERHPDKSDDYPLYGLDGHYIRIGHVRDARAALEALDGTHCA